MKGEQAKNCFIATVPPMLRFSMRSMPSIVSGGMLNGGSAIIDCLNEQSSITFHSRM
jgi:hypothetical protein